MTRQNTSTIEVKASKHPENSCMIVADKSHRSW